MNKKDRFFEELYNYLNLNGDITLEDAGFSSEVIDFLNRLQKVDIITPASLGECCDIETEIKKVISDKGLNILKYLQENYKTYNNILKAKEIGEGLSISSRSVSGSMRKLIADGYVTKSGSDPVCYSITDKGLEIKIEA